MDMKKILVLVIFSCLICCKTTEEPVEIKFSNSSRKVTLFYSKKMNTVSVISLPFNIKITNPSYEKKAFRNYTYEYGNQLKGNPIKLYSIQDNKLIKQSFSKNKYINSQKTNEYLIKSKHFIDTTKFNKIFFKPYIEKMKELNQDTLNIGTISELKLKHSDLLNELIKNDSLFFLFINEKSKSGFERKTIPIEY